MDQYQEMLEIFPTNKMTFERKVNAVIRLILLLSVIGFLITRSITFLVSGVVTVCAIMVLYFYQKNKEKEAKKKEPTPMVPAVVEGFEEVSQDKKKEGPIQKEGMYRGLASQIGMAEELIPQGGIAREQINTQQEMSIVMDNQYIPSTKTNPLSNVLLTEYLDDPLRKPAPPAFNPVITEDITSNVKKAVQSMNCSIDNTNTQLFGGLYNQFDLDQSNRAFYSTAITTIPNDQGAYASFLYGTMPSGKLDSEQRVKDNFRYLLY